MTWYVASVIISIRKRSGNQKNIPVYENFILIEGETSEEAIRKVSKMAVKDAEIMSDGLMLNDKPASMCFEGIRKLITISNPASISANSLPPVSGTELTYSEYLVKSKNQLKNLVNGKAVNIKYVD